MTSMRTKSTSGWGRAWNAGLLAAVIVAVMSGCGGAPNYEREARAKLTAFFSKEMSPQEFTIDSPWKKTFKPDNIGKRAPVTIENLELLEVRLPGSPNGLEAAFRMSFRADEPFQLKNISYPAGSYTSAGNMRFVETTRGILIRDADFAILTSDGKMVGANYLPWKTAK